MRALALCELGSRQSVTDKFMLFAKMDRGARSDNFGIVRSALPSFRPSLKEVPLTQNYGRLFVSLGQASVSTSGLSPSP